MSVVLFFDFDLTLTENHSCGSPADRHMILFDKIETETMVVDILKKLTLDYTVFIVSQGNRDQIEKYLKYKGIDNAYIYGSSNDYLMSCDWVKLKSQYITEQLGKLNPDYHVYIDDDIRNITKAHKFNINAVLAKAGQPLVNLLTVMKGIEIKQKFT